MNEIGIGVIGTGNIARLYHLPAMQQVTGAKLVVACDVDADRARQVAAQFGIPHWTTDFRDELRRPDVDAVLVLTTYHPKKEILLAAIAAGKHILTQKPLAGSVADGEEVVAAAERVGVRLVTSFMHRYFPESRGAKALLETGRLGGLQFVRHRNSTRNRYDLAVQWAGCVMDIGPHGVDLIRHLVGRPIVRVQALSDAYGPEGQAGSGPDGQTRPLVDAVVPQRPVETLAVCHYQFDNGLLASHEIQWTAHAGTLIYSSEFYGDRGTMLIRAPQAPKPVAFVAARQQEWEYPELDDEPVSGTYHHQLFIDDLRNGTNLSASAYDGLATLRVVEAIYLSAREGRTVTVRGG